MISGQSQSRRTHETPAKKHNLREPESTGIKEGEEERYD